MKKELSRLAGGLETEATVLERLQRKPDFLPIPMNTWKTASGV